MPRQLPPKHGTLGYGMNGLRYVKLPNLFQCKVCEKFKDSSPFHFSKKELNTFHDRVNKGQRLDSVSARLRCRECSGDPPNGLFCVHCEVIKPRDEFSQAARSRSVEAWCRDCVVWQQSVEPIAETLPIPSSVAPREGDKDYPYVPESSQTKAARHAESKMKGSSFKSPSVRSPSERPPSPVINKVATWLSPMHNSQVEESLVEDDNTWSTINYSITASLPDHRVPVGMPEAKSGMFREQLPRHANTPSSALDMDDNRLEFTLNNKALAPKAMYSNTILTPVSKAVLSVSAQSLLPNTNNENWQTVKNKKKKKKTPHRIASSFDGSSKSRDVVAYGKDPDGTFKWRPKYEFESKDDNRNNPSQYSSNVEGAPHKSSPEASDFDDDTLADETAPESPDLSDPKVSFYAPTVKSRKSLLEEDTPSVPKLDFSKRFTGIDGVTATFDASNKAVSKEAIVVAGQRALQAFGEGYEDDYDDDYRPVFEDDDY